ncbi:MAG: 30S ribosomal protein S2 [Candidatus Aenigmatarchaeota archaeon]|nr:MAG: 30S ribosomal protein S2 [Candidatus Aenigmarchaeota archaeon]
MTELADRNLYLAAGVHIGMREKNKEMLEYVFKRRADGLSVLDIEKTDVKIKAAGSFLGRFTPSKVLVVSRKAAGHKAAMRFSDATGARNIVGRFMPGALTNPSFKDYFEADAVILIDPASDKQALKEAIQRGIPVVALCDTYNGVEFIDLVIPTNNKGKKAVGLVLYLLAKEMIKARGADDATVASLNLERFQEE